MTEQQACTLCGAGGHTAAQCNWQTGAAMTVDLTDVQWGPGLAVILDEGRRFSFGVEGSEPAVEFVLAEDFDRVRGERDVALAAIAQLHSMLGVTDQVQAGERIGFLVGQSIMVPKLEARLTALEKQEPVAWVTETDPDITIGRGIDWFPKNVAKLPVGAKLYAAPVAQAGQVPDCPDRGPWRPITNGRRTVVTSDDFTHDVELIVTGDFADGDKHRYAKQLAAWMNAAAPAQGGE